ncbi:uncharacterized protein LOC130665391 isoform X1 [Microplitis mediator]|uniref:uncharacterized protein LOC130665391 isoform X1 n=1 Tax=Microplitis mediator TaxID=375433 RepID=UPI002552609F|nr:uncharacterized protein LOC130665391 isoform X1 [Microplitis mediator]
MPDSAAVYRPTTVGYSYEANGDGNESGVGVGGGVGLRNGFSRIMFRHKVSTRKWLEWVLLSVALCATVAGLTTMLVNVIASESSLPSEIVQDNSKNGSKSDTTTKVEDVVNQDHKGSLAAGASITLIGLVMGALWTWLRFFRHGGKSQRGGISRASGQMLGGLNPSTDLLVGSTSQYGPVLTEVPSQMTNKQIINETRAVPLSDQEEETHTLMPDSAAVPSAVTSDSSHPTNQLAG